MRIISSVCVPLPTDLRTDFVPQHVDQEIFENKAIELLDMASKILASANNAFANGRGCNPAGSTEEMPASTAFEGNEAIMLSRPLPDQQKQVLLFVGAAGR